MYKRQVPDCVPFSTFSHVNPLDCSITDCSCSTDTADCEVQLTCDVDTGAPSLLRYGAGPAECGGLRNMTCANFFDPPTAECCPEIDDALTQANECCPLLAEGEMETSGTFTTMISGMASCGDIDILACAARDPCHRCPNSQLCTEQRSFRDQEEYRKDSCRSTPLLWTPAANGTCVTTASSGEGSVPEAIVYSAPELFEQLPCGEDVCGPGLCQVTVCEPQSNGTCSAVAGPEKTVYALSDSPGVVCCAALPHNSRTPDARAILDNSLPLSELNVGHGCAAASSARQWVAVSMPDIDITAGQGVFLVRSRLPVSCKHGLCLRPHF